MTVGLTLVICFVALWIAVTVVRGHQAPWPAIAVYWALVTAYWFIRTVM